MNEEIKGNEQVEQQDILAAFANAANDLDEQEQATTDIVYEWSSERTTVRSIIKRYKEGKFSIPLCQRLYVWTEEQRLSLLDSINHGLPCNCITIAEFNGIQYLIDGLQRMTSLILLLNDKAVTVDQQKAVLNYNITVVIVKGFQSIEEMTNYFRKLNGGTALAAIVKERSKLSQKLNDALLTVSGNEFFRTISDKANATFSKSHHHEIIAMNALLAVSNLGYDDIKAKELCKRLTDAEEIIIPNIEKATALINRIASIYTHIVDDQTIRSMNANFVSVLAYIMAEHKEFTDGQYVSLINNVFANKRAIKDYSETTGSGSGDATKVQKRYNVIASILKGIADTEQENPTYTKYESKPKDEQTA
jgi:hypothetical protein